METKHHLASPSFSMVPRMIHVPSPKFSQSSPPSSVSSSPVNSQSPSSFPISPNNSNDRHQPSQVQVVMSPCAACKILRRRCVENCVLAPYFPPTEPYKFTIAHRVFGASNIIKFLQELPETQRADAVSSLVYEAKARSRDPIYGSAGVISQLQKQVNELQAQLAKSQAELLNMQCQHSQLLKALFSMDITDHDLQIHYGDDQDQSLRSVDQAYSHNVIDTSCFLDEVTNLGTNWESLLT